MGMRERAYAHASPEINGAKLRELRKAAGQTITAVAERAGISPSYLASIERGTRRTTAPATFIAICDAMQVDRTVLLREPTRDAA